MTYARARNAPWRERPTDRGRDARRYRDESFSIPLAVARLFGEGALRRAGGGPHAPRAAGEAVLPLARAGRRGAGAPAASARRARARRGHRATARVPRRARARGRLDGELVLDAATGAPLRVKLSGAFSVKADPRARAALELVAQVRALGGEVPTIAAPQGALPDERKPAGVAGALDAAGLRKRDEEKPSRTEPADEADE